MFPPLGQSVALQYQLEGNFGMLPFKIVPAIRAQVRSQNIELTLKIFNNIESTKKASKVIIKFHVPPQTEKVIFPV